MVLGFTKTKSQNFLHDSVTQHNTNDSGNQKSFVELFIVSDSTNLKTKNDFTQAELDNIESLYLEVSQMIYNLPYQPNNTFTISQIERLKEIAPMCPYNKGEAVYLARKQLSYIDRPYVDYRNECENVGAPEHSKARIANTTDTDSLNLVVDGSFEDKIFCPTSGSSVSELPQWSNSIGGAYFNQCSNSIYNSIPLNKYGFENTAEGLGYAGITTFCNVPNLVNLRNFLVGKLKTNLVNNYKYDVNFKMSLLDSNTVSCKNIAIYFTDTIPTYYYDPTPPYTLHWNLTHQPIQFYKDLSNKVGWTTLDTTYIASGNEKFLIIGNFLLASQSDSVNVGGNPDVVNGYNWNTAGYYVDDVRITLLEGTNIKPTSSIENDAYKIYPNPNSGSFTIQTDAFDKHAQFVITNAIGQVVDNIPVTSSTTTYKNKNLSNGLYYYTVVSAGLVTSRGKFLIQK